MTDLTNDALDALVARLHDDGLGFGIGPALLSQSAAVTITAMRQREATAVAGAIEAAAHVADRFDLSIMSTNPADMAARTIAATIRAMHTDATRAALDRVRAEGMREAAAWHIRQADAAMGALHCGSENSEFRAAGRLNDMHRDAASAILAAADKLGGKP